MKPARLPNRVRTDGRHRLPIAATAAALAPALLVICEQNAYVPPPTPRTILPVSAIRLPNK
jgi:hypothetical protein